LLKRRNKVGLFSGQISMRSRLLALSTVAVCAVSGTTLSANASPYTFTTIDAGIDTHITGINDSGQMVGYVGAFPTNNGFVYSNGVFSKISAPGATQGTEAYGISNSGQIVGGWEANWVTKSFIYNGGSYASLNNPLAINQTTALGINNSGQIVGFFRAATDTNYHGFLYSNGSYSTINAPGTAQGTATFLYGINDHSQMVGFFNGGNGVGYSFSVQWRRLYQTQ
jgi:probable HAF family extracellular repeat protein